MLFTLLQRVNEALCIFYSQESDAYSYSIFINCDAVQQKQGEYLQTKCFNICVKYMRKRSEMATFMICVGHDYKSNVANLFLLTV